MNKTEFKAQVVQYISEISDDDYQDKSEWLKFSAKAVDTFLLEPNADSNLARIIASFESLTIRDYALGVALKNPSVSFPQLNALLKACPVALASAPATILAIMAYSAGNVAQSRTFLDKAKQNYPLALLIKRVILAGWSAKEFTTMGQELHPEVVVSIYGELVSA
jgi:hypothetical protein